MHNYPIFEQLPHTADLKIRVFGATLEDLFRNALKGMFLSIGPIKENILIDEQHIPQHLDKHHTFHVESHATEFLLIDFLSEALYLSDRYNEAYFNAQFAQFTPTCLKATLEGISIDRFEVVEIKAVTYHGLIVEKINDFWKAEIVFDI